MQLLEQKYRAPEIYGEQWFNSEPIIISANRGRVICVYFWDATDQNSLHTLNYIKNWNRKYEEFGLIIIGVHSPKFPFGKKFSFVQKAVEDLGVKFPVVTDNEHYLRGIFKVRLVPSLILIDRSGYIRYFHEGEGLYQSFEFALQILLIDAGFRGDMPELSEPIREEDRQGIQCYKCTPEILVGYQHGSIGNTEGYFPQSVCEYHDPGLYLEGRVYLSGLWLINKYFIKSESSDFPNNYLTVRYRAKEVNAVFGTETKTHTRVFIIQDGVYLTKENAGNDIEIDETARSFVVVENHKMYNLVKNNEFGEHIIKLMPESESFTFYSMSFVTSPISELISGT